MEAAHQTQLDEPLLSDPEAMRPPTPRIGALHKLSHCTFDGIVTNYIVIVLILGTILNSYFIQTHIFDV